MASATYHRGVNLGGFDKLVEAVRGMGVHYNESDGFGWEIRKLREYRDAFFDACPVQPGDAPGGVECQSISTGSRYYCRATDRRSRITRLATAEDRHNAARDSRKRS
jgi:hypothetical protein